MKNYMENFIKTILPGSETVDNLSDSVIETKPSIATVIAKQSKLKSSVFASKSTRLDPKKSSQTPGPGSYINEFTGVHKIIKNIPESFGSTSTKKPNFLNQSINAPYSEPSYLDNPGVGNYNKKRFEKVKKIRLPGKSIIRHSEESNKGPFMSSNIRPCMVEEESNVYLPGPGAYDLNFREELKTLDQKYSQRYKKNPFGTRAPRFAYKNSSIQPKKSDIMLDDETLPKEPNVNRVFIDDTIERMKNEEARRTGYQFKSASKRFNHEKVPRNVEVVVKPPTFMMDDNRMKHTQSQITDTTSNFSHHKTTLMQQYIRSLNAPFNSVSPRFNYAKDSSVRMENPGPGSYSMMDKKDNKSKHHR